MSREATTTLVWIISLMITMTAAASIPEQECIRIAQYAVTDSAETYVSFIRGEVSHADAQAHISAYHPQLNGCDSEPVSMAQQAIQETLNAVNARAAGAHPAQENAHIERAFHIVNRLRISFHWEV